MSVVLANPSLPAGLPPELRALQGQLGPQASPLEGQLPGVFGAALEGAIARAEGPIQNPADALVSRMQRGVDAVNADLEAGDNAAQAFVRGEEIAVHEVMLAMTKADTSFRLMTTIGRKVIEAYQDVSRMQL